MSGWDTSKPISGTNILDIPEIHIGKWDAFEQTIEDEHYGFSEVLSGRHQSGLTGVVSAGPTSAVSAITNPASGALVWDETLGLGKMYVTGWEQVNMFPLSRVFVYRNADYTIPSSATSNTPEVIPFNTESKDTLSEYDNTAYTFTASATGYYLVGGRLSISTIGGVGVASYVSIRDSEDTEQYKAGTFNRHTLSTDECPMLISVLVYLTAGQKIKTYIYHDYSGSIILEGGQERSFLKIHRIS